MVLACDSAGRCYGNERRRGNPEDFQKGQNILISHSCAVKDPRRTPYSPLHLGPRQDGRHIRYLQAAHSAGPPFDFAEAEQEDLVGRMLTFSEPCCSVVGMFRDAQKAASRFTKLVRDSASFCRIITAELSIMQFWLRLAPTNCPNHRPARRVSYLTCD